MNTSLETKAIHAGEIRLMGSVVTPIFQTSMFEHANETRGKDLKYVRYSNLPNHIVLAKKLAALENTESALVTASGMAAISTALITVLEGGGHLLVHNNIYGGTRALIEEDLHTMGMSYDWIDADDPQSWTQKIKPETKAIYTEALSNPVMEVVDHEAVVAFANQNNLVSLIDNTFASPVNFRPAEIGYDIILHSGTKYLNGHSDLAAGVVASSEEWIDRIHTKLNHFGGSMDPHACYLFQRGIKTLAVRVRHQNQSALEIARFLETHPRVTKVNYPGLDSHSQATRAARLFDGYSGMLSFVLDVDQAGLKRFISKLNLFVNAVSLGGVESLVIEPARTSHINLTPEQRVESGIPDNMLRMSIGLESVDDLIADIKQALEE